MEIEIISKEVIKPSSPTPPHLKTYKLSILDQMFSLPYIPLILFYPSQSGENLSEALEKSVCLKKSLSRTLTQFYPLAGMIQKDYSVNCNDAGANYVVALVHARLENFLSNPKNRLIHKFLPFIPSLDESSEIGHVTNIQVNIFECGGMAMGLCVSHKVIDTTGLSTFLRGWMNMTCGDNEVVYPNLTTPSLFPAKSLWLKDITTKMSRSMLKEGNRITKRFVFDSDAMAKLKTEAARNGVEQPTRVEVVSALMWKCAIAASKEAYHIEEPSTLSHAVNLRRKLATTLSKDLIGNTIWIANAVCPANYETTLHDLVKLVRESILKINVEFVNNIQGDEGYVAMQKSLQEMGENIVSNGMSRDSYSCTSWCKMGLYEIDFGWGSPTWVAAIIGEGLPVFRNFVNLIDTKYGEGIEAWVTLDEERMKILQRNEELLTYASIDPSPLASDYVATLPIP